MKHICLVYLVLFLVNILFAWSPPGNLGISGADDINPQACRVQLINNFCTCLVWQTNIDGTWDIFSRFGGAWTWEDTLRITSGFSDNINPTVAYDFIRDCFWCVWQTNGFGNWDIFATQGDFYSGWSALYLLTSDASDDELPSVYVNHDTVWVVWQRGVNILSACYDGTIWSTPIPITNDSVIYNTKPKINGRYNHPIVVWERDGDIYYSEYLSGSWQTPQPVTTDPGNDCNPELTSECWGDPFTWGTWVVWQTDRHGNDEIYTTAYDNFNVHYRMTFNDSADITPHPLFILMIVEQNYPPLTVISTNRNGNYDIYAYFDWGYSEIVDTCHSEDILPVIAGADYYVWTLWQTDRNSEWDIYGSYIFVGGVEETNTYGIKSNSSLTVSPNPFRQITDISFCVGLSADGIEQSVESVVLKIYDSSGRVVKDFSSTTPYAPRPTHISWDGTDNNGKRLPEGIYFVQLRGQTEILTDKIVLVK